MSRMRVTDPYRTAGPDFADQVRHVVTAATIVSRPITAATPASSIAGEAARGHTKEFIGRST